MKTDALSGAAANAPSPNAPSKPVVSRGVTTGQLRDSKGRFAGKAARVIEREPTPWDRHPEAMLRRAAEGEHLARLAETPLVSPEVLELRERVSRRWRLHRFIRNASIALGIFIVVYFAAQFLRLAI